MARVLSQLQLCGKAGNAIVTEEEPEGASDPKQKKEKEEAEELAMSFNPACSRALVHWQLILFLVSKLMCPLIVSVLLDEVLAPTHQHTAVFY